MPAEPIQFHLNGRTVKVNVPPATPLLDTLRDELFIMGSKESCGKGECGSCTVLLDGEPVCSCLLMTGQVAGAEVTTVEGLGTPEQPDPLQAAFVECGAVQCGYCIPGFIVAARALLNQHPRPTQAQIREGLAGNICRCTGYQKILQAVARVAGAGRPG